MKLLLLLQLFATPITNAYAAQVKKDVVVSITYTTVLPTKACTFIYDLDDEVMETPTRYHCWTPKVLPGDFDVWPGESLETIGNMKCMVQYPNGQTLYMVLKYFNS